ncbi:serine/threonine-protein kinase [Hyalangium gracile]|uniref:serine/threonine-protein kinase n=1 Tax=Hyalangium gracile TaxID=394092 RepID=UPI001CCB69BD|nr:serine/threonine-protein kinase [Hyalangium gracile]
MASAAPPSLSPALLPPGTEVGPWRLVAWAGQGVHGAVYRAVPAHSQHAPAVALKLALHPEDPRFAREAQLLSRLRHPSVPRLWDSGTWQSPDGTLYPWLAMDWVDGVSLYEWAEQPATSSRACFRVLAQLARALQALHALGAVHRDLKGENVRVRHSDGRAMLTDFGLGTFPGAERLTPPATCLGTPLYRSPEAGLFDIHSRRHRSLHYVPTPADDLYALGMVACRLLTGEYPEWVDPTQDENGTWKVRKVRKPASLRGVEPSVRACIVRLLAVRPEQRGTAAQFAEALERAAHPHFEPARPSVPGRPGRWPWLAPAVGLALGVWGGWLASEQTEGTHSRAQARTEAAPRDAGTAGLGEAACTAATVQAPEASLHEPLAENPLPEPQPKQLRPDGRGRCPHRRQVALNGACWIPFDPEACEAAVANGYLFKGKCYVPALSPDRPSTSHPTRPP